MITFMETLFLASRDAAVLSLIVGLLLILVGRYLPACWRHGIWLLVAARLLMPVLPTSQVSLQRVLEVQQPVVSALPELPHNEIPFIRPPVIVEEKVSPPVFNALGQNTSAIDGTVAEVVKKPERIDVWKILFRIWVLGVISVLGLAGFFTWRFSRRLRRCSAPDARQAELETFLGRLGDELDFLKLPRLRVCEAVDVPALYGLFRPVILVPPSALERLSETELRLVLMHELGHWKRRDLWLNLMLALLQAVHWFNPLVWWTFHRTRIESERATDAWVLRRAGAGENTNYGGMLLRLLDPSPKPRAVFSGIVSVVESPKDLKRRMVGIVKFSGKRNRWAVVGSVAIMLILATVGLTQSPEKGKADEAIAEEIAENAQESFDCHVTSEDGKSVAGAEVFLLPYSGLSGDPMSDLVSCGLTDETGLCQIPIRSEWRETPYTQIKLFARHPGSGYGGIYQAMADVGVQLDLPLTNGTSLKFRVEDKMGLPVPDLKLRVVRAESPVYEGNTRPKLWGTLPPLPEGFWSSKTDKDGLCSIDGLAPGKYYVDHEDIRYGQIPGYWRGDLHHNPTETKGRIGIVLQPSSTVSGTVSLPNGKPVVGAKVSIIEERNYFMGGLTAETTTDENGQYRLERLLPAKYNLSVNLGNGLEKEWISEIKELLVGSEEQRADVNPILSEGAMVTGRVTLADTGEGVADLAVGIVPRYGDSSVGSITVVTDDDGRFHARAREGMVRVYIVGLVPDGYTREIGKNETQAIEIELKDDETFPVNIALKPKGIIRGIVVNELGNPVAGANLACSEENAIRAGGNVKISDKEGRFSIYLPIGVQSAKIAAEYEGMISDPLKDFQAGQEARLVIKPNSLASASGRVTYADGKALVGARVSWRKRRSDKGGSGAITAASFSSLSEETKTDRNGEFEAIKVLPGEGIIFEVTKAGWSGVRIPHTLEAGESADLGRFELAPADSFVSGKVVDFSGKPCPGAKVVVINGITDVPSACITDKDGKFRIDQLANGWVDLVATGQEPNVIRNFPKKYLQGEKRVVSGSDDVVIRVSDHSRILIAE